MESDSILKNISRHVLLDPHEADFFVSLLQHKTLKRKELLLQPGEICRTENFIIKGCMRIYTVDATGSESIMVFGTEDWWVSDLYSFLTQTPTTYYIEAIEETEIWQITKPDLDKLYGAVPKFERFFRIILQNAYVAQQQRINQNLSFTAEERYLHFIQKFPQLEQRIPQKQIAAYLGITPEFLSMMRRKLAGK